MGWTKYRTYLASKSEYVDANIVLKGQVGAVDNDNILPNNSSAE